MDRFQRLAQAENYALYYGSGQGEELARFDLAIVEPAGQSALSLHAIKRYGTLTLAYLSIMEVAPWAPEMPALAQSDFLHLNGGPYINPAYGNYWVDIRSGRWGTMLRQRISSLLEGAGYDGLFLDTIGYVEAPFLPERLRAGLLSAAAGLVRKLRYAYPEHIIVQNGGLVELFRHTAGYVNGFCWENPPLGSAGGTEWVQGVVANLSALRDKDIQVLLLWDGCDECPDEVLTIAGQKRFLVYRAPGSYVAGINLAGR